MAGGGAPEGVKHAPGFTPVRRPESNIVKGSPSEPSGPAWTTRRCNRLLRPISAYIISLRKLRYEVTNARRAHESGATAPKGAEVVLSAQHGAAVPPKNNEDPEWVPGHRQGKKAARTYANRANALQRAQSQKPLIARSEKIGDTNALKMLLEESLMYPQGAKRAARDLELCSYDTREGFVGSLSRNRFQMVLKSLVPTQWSLHDGLWAALENLLASTPRRPPATKGPASLFKMCLKAVPKRIALDRALELEDDPDSTTDMSEVTYNELEAFGSTNGMGWKSLRIVVRAHGVQLIGEAIREGLVHPIAARDFVRLCYREGAIEEAETLTNSLLSSMKPLSTPDSSTQLLFLASTSEPLQLLKQLWASADAWGRLFSGLTRLLEEKTVSVAWMAATDMSDVWNQAIHNLIDDDRYSKQALDLLKITVAQSCWALEQDFAASLHRLRTLGAHEFQHGAETSNNDKPNHSLTTTISNLLIPLVSVASVKPNSDTAGSAREVVLELFQEMLLIRQFIKQSGFQLKGPEASRFCYVMFSGLLLLSGSGCDADASSTNNEQLADMWTFGLDCGLLIGDLATFGCSLARCCERIAPSGRSAYAEAIVNAVLWRAELTPQGPAYDPRYESTLRRLAVDMAREYAESTSRQADLDWALEVEDLFTDRDAIEPSKEGPCANPGVKQSSGFRWEESIGEWVERTPAVVRVKLATKNAPGCPTTPNRPTATDGCMEEEEEVALAETPVPPRRQSKRMSDQSMTLLDLTATPAQPLGRFASSPSSGSDAARASPKVGKGFDLSLLADLTDEDELSATPNETTRKRRPAARRSALSEVSLNRRARMAYVEANADRPKPRPRGRPKRQTSDSALDQMAREASAGRLAKRKRVSEGCARGMDPGGRGTVHFVLGGDGTDSEDELGRSF